jgi:hypothetical protein
MFNINEVVYLKKEVLLDSETIEEDCLGFRVLATEADIDDTIPVARVLDGQYSCLPVWVITREITQVTGNFFINSQGKLRLINVHVLDH